MCGVVMGCAGPAAPLRSIARSQASQIQERGVVASTYESLITRVAKPARYSGGELNASSRLSTTITAR